MIADKDNAPAWISRVWTPELGGIYKVFRCQRQQQNNIGEDIQQTKNCAIVTAGFLEEVFWPVKKTNKAKQTNTQANRQKHNQASKQASKQTSKQEKPREKQTNRQTSKHTNKQNKRGARGGAHGASASPRFRLPRLASDVRLRGYEC